MSPWKLVYAPKRKSDGEYDGHRLFQHRESRVFSIADNSGGNPDYTDDGVLVPLRMHLNAANVGCTVKVWRTDTEGTVWLTHADALAIHRAMCGRGIPIRLFASETVRPFAALLERCRS